jgi:hypothetical protein
VGVSNLCLSDFVAGCFARESCDNGGLDHHCKSILYSVEWAPRGSLRAYGPKVGRLTHCNSLPHFDFPLGCRRSLGSITSIEKSIIGLLLDL